MEKLQLACQHNYFCYNCGKNLSSKENISACMRCDSSAILQCHTQKDLQIASQFEIVELKNNKDRQEPQGFLQNSDSQNSSLSSQRSISIVSIRSIGLLSQPSRGLSSLRQHLNRRLSNLHSLSSLTSLLEMLFEEEEQGATEEQINKLQKIEQVKQCSICQNQQEQQESTETQNESENEESEKNKYKGYKLGCGHSFHIDCISPWFQKSDTCPLCRRSIGQEQQV